jgi:ABC-type glycerol-3-phosphate transport system substrate-binding protein
MSKWIVAILGCISLAAACVPATAADPTPVPATATLVVAPFLTPEATPQASERHLTLWVAPQFAPSPDTVAGQLLVDRLAAFEAANPGLTVHTRIKARSGPAGLLETLTAASLVAPDSLPDVITLDWQAMHAAAVKSMIVPLETFGAAPVSPAWSEQAVLAAQVDGVSFGLPLASETEVLAYRADIYGSAPDGWSQILNGPKPFVFPANDPSATFTLGQYLALGGPLRDVSGRPDLAVEPLTDVLAWYDALHDSGVLPLSSTQMTSAGESWAAVRDGRAASAVAPLDAALPSLDNQRLAAAPVPGRSVPGTTLLRPWNWSVVTRDPSQQRLAIQLMDWLSQPDFLGPWTHALGLLPPTPEALQAWPEAEDALLVSSLLATAQLLPEPDLQAIVGPALQEASLAVISGRESPQDAAAAAVEAIRNP